MQIVHNDLHKDNIMLRSTDVVIDRYVFGDGQTFEYETYGYEPVIIDFGLAFTGGSKMRMNPLYTWNVGCEQIAMAIDNIVCDFAADAIKEKHRMDASFRR